MSYVDPSSGQNGEKPAAGASKPDEEQPPGATEGIQLDPPGSGRKAFDDELRVRLAKGGKLLPLGDGSYFKYRGSRKAALKRLADGLASARRQVPDGGAAGESK